MSVLSDTEIRAANIVHPCLEGVSGPGILSYGLSSYGYDVRLGHTFKMMDPRPHRGVPDDEYFQDPKRLTDYETATFDPGEPVNLKPGGYVLAETVESFVMPRDVIGVVVGKSSYARCGLVVNCTPLEPGWEGVLTLELSNPTPWTIRLHPGEGIAQILFFWGWGVCEKSYPERGGKYQGQTGVTGAKGGDL